MRMTISSLATCVFGLSMLRPHLRRPSRSPCALPETPGKRALVLRSLDGKTLAQGSVNVTVRDGRATSQVVFHFTDGSVHDETTVFSQNDVFRLLSYRLDAERPRISLDPRDDAGHTNGAGHCAS